MNYLIELSEWARAYFKSLHFVDFDDKKMKVNPGKISFIFKGYALN